MFRNRIVIFLFLLSILASSANAATYFTGNLNAAQETPPNEAAPTGFWVLPSNGSPHTFFAWGISAAPDDFPVAGYNNR